MNNYKVLSMNGKLYKEFKDGTFGILQYDEETKETTTMIIKTKEELEKIINKREWL